MTSGTLPPSSEAAGRATSPAPAAARAALALLRHLQAGTLTVRTPDGATHQSVGSSQPDLHAVLDVHDWSTFSATLRAGDIGFAETFMAGAWTTPQLADLLRLILANREVIEKAIYGSWWGSLLHRVQHALHRNTRSGSRRNIQAHYDLGNAFYERWLDPTMTYSAARFENPGQSLPAAQWHKYSTLAQSMALGPDQHVLEIGCGWGGFAEFAAREVGARVTGITISREQHDFAKRRLFEKGLAEKADIRLIDYRDIQGQFDSVASIEMFEAVGEEYWPTYFGKVHDLLSPGGRAALQIITIRDELFDDYRSRADFIQKYVFPGGMLGSEKRLRQETDRAGLEWREIARFGQDYAATLAEWGASFQAAWDEIKALGFDERFRRLWQFYLSYCEAGFRSGRTNVIQLGLARA